MVALYEFFIRRSDTDISFETQQLFNGSSVSNDFIVPFVVVVAGDIIANVSFVYKPNPVIEDVYPLKGIQASVICFNSLCATLKT